MFSRDFFNCWCSLVKCSFIFVFKCKGSDDSLSGSDEEEQQLWEETQLGKGVKGHPGEQVELQSY